MMCEIRDIDLIAVNGDYLFSITGLDILVFLSNADEGATAFIFPKKKNTTLVTPS